MLSRWLSGKESACQSGNTRDMHSMPGQEDPLEKKMSTDFIILAWEIPWREEPGGLWNMWSQRGRHRPATKQQHINWMRVYALFLFACLLFSLRKITLRLTGGVFCTIAPSFERLDCVSWYGCGTIYLSIHLLMDIWIVFSLDYCK